MGFNYGYEKKKFDSRWKRLEVEYCDAGMSEEQIAAMKEYDWAWFCSQSLLSGFPEDRCQSKEPSYRLWQAQLLNSVIHLFLHSHLSAWLRR